MRPQQQQTAACLLHACHYYTALQIITRQKPPVSPILQFKALQYWFILSNTDNITYKYFYLHHLFANDEK